MIRVEAPLKSNLKSAGTSEAVNSLFTFHLVDFGRLRLRTPVPLVVVRSVHLRVTAVALRLILDDPLTVWHGVVERLRSRHVSRRIGGDDESRVEAVVVHRVIP